MKRLAQLHKALSDETRLRILFLLLELGELCVCDVETALSITQSKASRHLGLLKQAGLVDDRRDGTWVYHRIRDDLDAVATAACAGIRQVGRASAGATEDLRHANEARRSPVCRPRESA